MSKDNSSPQHEFLFGKENFIILGIGALLVILGFVLMAGGGSEDPNEFNPAIFSTQRIVIAPILIIGGFVLNIYGIMRKRKA